MTPGDQETNPADDVGCHPCRSITTDVDGSNTYSATPYDTKIFVRKPALSNATVFLCQSQP
ncbi:hypothetical protein [Mucilaginibacter gracilis]|uniref:hypothetical protein n=1 Tax=Mucilaginibacter gracilis TaxID=423350 RepID=UPI0013C2B5BD|nr:hypothetical protein [Mucilaginibacter gracilis]